MMTHIRFLFSVMVLGSGVLFGDVIKDDLFDYTDTITTTVDDRQGIKGRFTTELDDYKNCIVEFDIWVKGERGFPGIRARVDDNQNGESFYIRPHRPNDDDSVQYTPVYEGRSNWQLYWGRGYTARGNFPVKQWFHISIKLINNQAWVYFDKNPEPVLYVKHMANVRSMGRIEFKSPKYNDSAFFANPRITRLPDHPDSVVDSEMFREPGIIEKWEIAGPFSNRLFEGGKYPDKEMLDSVEWVAVSSESSGMVCTYKHLTPVVKDTNIYLARATITSDKKHTVKYDFGYNDLITVFLNGNPEFSGNYSFRSRQASFIGFLDYKDSLYLPLDEGDNELFLMLTEYMGGNGFQFRESGVKLYSEGLKSDMGN